MQKTGSFDRGFPCRRTPALTIHRTNRTGKPFGECPSKVQRCAGSSQYACGLAIRDTADCQSAVRRWWTVWLCRATRRRLQMRARCRAERRHRPADGGRRGGFWAIVRKAPSPLPLCRRTPWCWQAISVLSPSRSVVFAKHRLAGRWRVRKVGPLTIDYGTTKTEWPITNGQ